MVCLPRGFGNPVPFPAGECELNGLGEADSMPDGNKDGLHAITGPHNGSDGTVIGIIQRRMRPARRTWYAMPADQERLGTTDRRFVQAEADVAGNSG